MSSQRRSYIQTLFKDSLKDSPVAEYGKILDYALNCRFTTPREAVLVLFQSSSPYLWSHLVHKSEANPDIRRDDRLLAWFEACEAAGADVRTIIEQETANRRDFRTGAKSLLRSGSMKTIAWWKARGLEQGLTLTEEGHAPTTLASLAVYYGMADMAKALLPGSTLDHPEILWPRLWRKDMLASADRLASMLIDHGPVPSDFLTHLPQSGINLGNVDSVLSLTRRVLDSGQVSMTPQQATECLAALVKHLRSPASLELVHFFLEQGADPIGQWRDTPLSNALQAWSSSTLTHGLRTTQRQCVEMLIAATTPHQALSVLTPARVEALTKSVRQKEPSPTIPVGAVVTPSVADAGPDVAWLRQIYLTLSTVPAPCLAIPRAPKM